MKDAQKRHGNATTSVPGIDPATRIETGCGPIGGLTVSRNGGLLIATHAGDDSLSLIDATSGMIERTVVDVDEPFAVAVSPAGVAYVSTSSASYDSVLAYDVDAGEVVRSYPQTAAVTDVALSPNGRQAYAGRTDASGAGVAILDSADGDDRFVRIADAGTATECLQPSPDGRRLFVAANGAATAALVVVDVRRNQLLSTIDVGSPIRDIAVSPDGGTVYIGSCGPDFGTVLDVVDVHDARRCAIVATHKIGDAENALSRMTISRDGRRLYLVGDSAVTVLSTDTHDVLGSITTGAQPSCATESPAGDRLYISDYAGAVTAFAVDPAALPAAFAWDEWASGDLRTLEPSLA